MHRRHFLGLGAAAAALSLPASAQSLQVRPGTVRDRLWTFCNPVNADYNYVKTRSVITPVESALYLGIPNIIMVNQYPSQPENLDPNSDGFYQPWRSPLQLHAFPTRMLRRVVWSIVGASGKTNLPERNEAIALAKKTPNFVGMMMDDFIRKDGQGALTVEQVADISRELKSGDRKLDLYAVLYEYQFESSFAEYLKYIDVVTFWTWRTQELARLEENFAVLERLAPKARKMLGCYTTSYDPKAAVRWTELPVETMRKQCETGLRWLQEGRIEGIIIYGNFLELDWDCMKWVRDWIARVGDQPLRKT